MAWVHVPKKPNFNIEFLPKRPGDRLVTENMTRGRRHVPPPQPTLVGLVVQGAGSWPTAPPTGHQAAQTGLTALRSTDAPPPDHKRGRKELPSPHPTLAAFVIHGIEPPSPVVCPEARPHRRPGPTPRPSGAEYLIHGANSRLVNCWKTSHNFVNHRMDRACDCVGRHNWKKCSNDCSHFWPAYVDRNMCGR